MGFLGRIGIQQNSMNLLVVFEVPTPNGRWLQIAPNDPELYQNVYEWYNNLIIIFMDVLWPSSYFYKSISNSE